MSFSAPDIVDGVSMIHPLTVDISGVSIDTRTLKEAELYIAIRGENLNGHDYISEAVAGGASGIVASRTWYSENQSVVGEDVPLFLVTDTQLFLGLYANNHRKEQNKPVIGITGSNGKTTVKEMAALVLSKIGRVHKTEGNRNNHIGVPMTLLSMPDSAEYVIIEMGINQPGEMSYLCSIAEPDVALITNVEIAHTQFFADIDKVAQAKGEIFTHMAAGGTAIVNIDDPRIEKMGESLERKLIYSFNFEADVQGRIVQMEKDSYATVEFNGCKPFTLKVIGKKMASNALAAAAIGLKFAVPIPDIRDAIASYEGFKGRMSRLEIAGRIIIDDTYNANPSSVELAVDTLVSFNSSSKKIVVFGDMLELGRLSEQKHREAGMKMADVGISAVYGFGPGAELTVEEAKNGGVNEVSHFESKKELADRLMDYSESGDMILVKGSRGMKMEDVIGYMSGEST